MKILRWSNNQAGFTLIQALFILVVLALLGTVMMRLVVVQSSTSAYALQGARAYHAALSGIEWGAARASSGAPCNGAFTVADFSVTVSCSNSSFTEGTASAYPVFRFTSVATYGSYGNPDFIQRALESKVGFP